MHLVLWLLVGLLCCAGPVGATDKQICDEPTCASSVDLADPDLAYVAKQLDWLGSNVDERFFEQLKARSASLRDDLNRRTAYLDALLEEGAAALLLGDARYAIDRLTSAERLANRRLPRDDVKRLRLQLVLSIAYGKAKKFEAAADALSRAQKVVILREGANSPTQLNLIYRRAELLTHNGSLWLAGKQYRSALRLTRKAFGEQSVETVEANLRLGHFLKVTGEYKPALTVFRKAIKRMRQPDRSYHPLAVRLLLARADTFLTGELAEHALDQVELAHRIMDEHPDTFSVEQRIDAAYQYGELLMLRHLEGRAMEQFKIAWELAAANGIREWLQRLAKPELVRNRLFRAGTPGEAGLPLSFDLSADGRPRRVQIDATDQASSVAGFARDLMRTARVRPPIVNGEPHALDNQELTMVFQAYEGTDKKPLFQLNPNRPPRAQPARVRSRPAYRPDYRPPVTPGGGKASA